MASGDTLGDRATCRSSAVGCTQSRPWPEKNVRGCSVCRGSRFGHLLAHGTLIRVAGALVVVRVRDEAGTDAEQRERRDLHVRCLRRDVPTPQSCKHEDDAAIVARTTMTANSHFIQRDQAVVLFIHVQVLDESFSQTISEGSNLLLQLLRMLVSEHADAVLDDDVRSAYATSIAR